MKGRHILACALASLVAFAPLSLVGASAYTYGPNEEGGYEPLLSPLNGFTYLVYDTDSGWIITKECATTYELDSDNEIIDKYADLSYSFFGGVSENFMLLEEDIYSYPQLKACNQLFYIDRDSATIAKPSLTALIPFHIDVEANVVIRRESSWVGSENAVVPVNFTLEAVEYNGGEYYNLPLQEILDTLEGYGEGYVVDNICLFESITVTVSAKNFSLFLDGYEGIPLSLYDDFCNVILADYYGYAKPDEPTPPTPPAENIDDAYEAVLAVPKAFLETEFLPNFTFGKLILIILGFVIFGFAIKLCFGG